MAVDERSRHALHTKLQEVLGESEAAVLMEHLPPAGWSDVVTKSDLRLELAALEHKISAVLYERLNAQTRAMMIGFVSSFIGLGGLVLAAARLG